MAHDEWLHEPSLQMHAVQSPVLKSQPAGSSHLHRSRERRALIGLLVFNGVGAVGGGVALLIGKTGLPQRLLEGTPFDTYTTPGWILLLAVGGSSSLAAILVLAHYRFAGDTAIAAGAVLLGWIVTEFVMIPEAWAPQLLYFVIGCAILTLGFRMRRRAVSGSRYAGVLEDR